MKALLSILAALLAVSSVARSQDPDAPATKPSAAAAPSTQALKLKLFLVDPHGTQIAARGVKLHLSGAKISGSGDYLTDSAGERRLSLPPGAYTLDVIAASMCSFALTIKAGQDAALALLIPPQSGKQCPLAKEDATTPVAAASDTSG